MSLENRGNIVFIQNIKDNLFLIFRMFQHSNTTKTNARERFILDSNVKQLFTKWFLARTVNSKNDSIITNDFTK